MSEPNAEQGLSEIIEKAQKEVTSVLDATNPSQVSEQVTSQPSNDLGGAQSGTERPLNGEEAKEPPTEKPLMNVEESESKKDEGGEKGAEETATGVDHVGETTKEGEPAQIGEKRAHPEDAADGKGEGDEGIGGIEAKKVKTDEGIGGTEAKKVKTDESKPAEDETETTKGKGGRKKSTRKTTATTKSTTNTERKKRSVGRPRENAAAAEKPEEKKDGGEEKMETARPVAEQIN